MHIVPLSRKVLATVLAAMIISSTFSGCYFLNESVTVSSDSTISEPVDNSSGSESSTISSTSTKETESSSESGSESSSSVSKPAATETEKQAQAVLDKIIKAGMSDFDKAFAIHNWLTFNVEYDFTYSHYHAIDAFKYRTAVCQGYAEAFELMASRAGLEAHIVTGEANNGSGFEGHAWNQVKIDGKWYNVDCTWDDPSNYPGSNEANHYDYFLISDATINKDHRTGDSAHKTCSSDYNRVNIFRKAVASGMHGDILFAGSQSELSAIAKKYIDSGMKSVIWYYDATKSEDEKIKALTNAITSQIKGTYHTYSWSYFTEGDMIKITYTFS